MTEVAKHIMFIDDEPNILGVGKIALESVGGFRVSTCSSGQEALTRVGDIKPEIVLLDVMMPGMDGPTTFAKLKAFEILKNVPVIFMTAKVQPKEVASYIGLGATGVILKPFDPMKLSEEVDNLFKSFHARK